MKLKRKVSFVLVALVLVAGVLFFYLPMRQNLEEKITFTTSPNALFRQLLRDEVWPVWWPGTSAMANGKLHLTCNDINFSVRSVLQNTLVLMAKTSSDSAIVHLALRPDVNNKVTATIRSTISLRRNPIHRIQDLRFSFVLKGALTKILSKLGSHFALVSHLYDYDIKETTVPFEFFCSTSDTLKHYPSVAEYYDLIEKIHRYVRSGNEKEIGEPLLHVEALNREEYLVQVAVPVSNALPERAPDIKAKWMLKGGHILSAKVIGGNGELTKASIQITNYILDYGKATVAIPFEYLVTDRRTQQDTSRWVTELYYPII